MVILKNRVWCAIMVSVPFSGTVGEGQSWALREATWRPCRRTWQLARTDNVGGCCTWLKIEINVGPVLLSANLALSLQREGLKFWTCNLFWKRRFKVFLTLVFLQLYSTLIQQIKGKCYIKPCLAQIFFQPFSWLDCKEDNFHRYETYFTLEVFRHVGFSVFALKSCLHGVLAAETHNL